MNEKDGFLAWVGSRLRDAEIAVHNGDATLRREIWSRREPVSVLGAWRNVLGREQVDGLFTLLENSFSDSTSYEYELLAADVVGDMAYTVGYEHSATSVNGEPRAYTLRATQVYRREGGERKVVHRHADPLAEEDRP